MEERRPWTSVTGVTVYAYAAPAKLKAIVLSVVRLCKLQSHHVLSCCSYSANNPVFVLLTKRQAVVAGLISRISELHLWYPILA
eukprot:6214269-Pleurochrysis_carterae.AAC.2